jgi:energy-coupling factor transporter ATP-binding protein EcfA2
MSFALCLYYANEGRQLTTYPKLLLFDEVDAHLHPSMSRHFIKTIVETLVEKLGVNVVATTHSPSTVAVAPEESVFVMKAGLPGLHKSSKAAALNLLTDGVPTLALSIDGRRQVFVESPADVEVCTALYDLLKPDLPAGRSLQFVATGTKNSNGGTDKNTGVDITLSMVEQLVTAGNQSVFALVDADKQQRRPNPKKRIHVFASGMRDGLENCIYDPLILLLLVSRHAQSQFEVMGIPKTLTDTELAKMTKVELQNLVEKIQSYLLGEPSEKTILKTIRYKGGLELNIRDDYLLHDDHDLEKLILEEKITALKRYGSNNAGARTVQIVNSEMRAYQDFIPYDLFQTFVDLLEAEGHLHSNPQEPAQ